MEKGRILIVDDEQINLDFFDVMLSKLGFIVEKAEDGEEALEKVQTTHPDLIILDNIMPKKSGWDVTKELKQDPRYKEFRDIPIIMFSAMDDVKDKIEGFELGIEDYITKPFNFSEVLARIKAVLRNRELAQQLVHRERRITIIESLKDSLVYFTRHLKTPVVDLLNASKELDFDNVDAMKEYVSKVQTEFEATLATLSGLEEEIEELQNKDAKVRSNEVTLEALEEKYQRHFKNWKDRAKSLDSIEN